MLFGKAWNRFLMLLSVGSLSLRFQYSNYELNFLPVLQANQGRTPTCPRKRSIISFRWRSWPRVPYKPVYRCEGTCKRKLRRLQP
jgi:hypothetical protein